MYRIHGLMIAAIGFLGACEPTLPSGTPGGDACWVGTSSAAYTRDGSVLRIGRLAYWGVSENSFTQETALAEASWIKSAEGWKDRDLAQRLEKAIANDDTFVRYDPGDDRLQVMIPLARASAGTAGNDDPDYLVLTSWLKDEKRWSHGNVWCKNSAALAELKP